MNEIMKDAEKFFREFLIKNPGMVDKNPGHEGAEQYVVVRSLQDGADAMVEKIFNFLAHKWGIYNLRLGEAQVHYIEFFEKNRRLKLPTSIAKKAAASYAEEKGLSELQQAIVEAYYLTFASAGI